MREVIVTKCSATRSSARLSISLPISHKKCLLLHHNSELSLISIFVRKVFKSSEKKSLVTILHVCCSLAFMHRLLSYYINWYLDDHLNEPYTRLKCSCIYH